MTQISDQLPEDIVYLIRNISDGNITDSEMEGILPDFHVRVAVVDEGKNLPVSPEVLAKAEAWISQQRDFQRRASEAWAVLQRAEPINQVAIGKGGQLPSWFGYNWSANLMFDWASKLHLAVLDAETYISERGLK